MKKIFLFIVVLAGLAIFGANAYSQSIISGTFAIKNPQTQKDVRPYRAGTADGNKIILYPHQEWKCMTWNFRHIEGSTYQLENLFTGKTFQASSAVKAGVTLWQQPLVNNDSAQYWEFLKQDNDTYLIRLKNTELYITISSDETNSNIILMPYQRNSTKQQWALIEQSPTF
ncbi:MAG: RICIN domain-containing protein [Elusimicrobiota bacterium]|nr:RICIN domain-containing protein [Elusimicrobiota bacterium]